MRQNNHTGGRPFFARPRLVAVADADWLLLDRNGELLGKVHAPKTRLVFGKSAPTFLLQDYTAVGESLSEDAEIASQPIDRGACV